jgi:prepilin signal peptidase PulO-like enzyme (type II secretory pathway)
VSSETAPFALGAALAGWLCGGLSAYAAAWLLFRDGEGRRPRPHLLQDPLVQGVLAVIWLALVLARGPTMPSLLCALAAIPLVQVAVTDIRTRYVYTLVAAPGIALGVVASPFMHGSGMLSGVVGAVVGGLVLALMYGLGRLLYRGQEPMARGDVIIGAMVGAIAGPCVAYGLVYGVLAGGLLAAGLWIVHRSGKVVMPYGPGLCLGGLVTLFMQ